MSEWAVFDIDNFERGPQDWIRNSPKRGAGSEKVHKLLFRIRHALAHSNLFFGGEIAIEHIYLGSWVDKQNQDKYRVLQCTVPALNQFLDRWIDNVQKLRASPELIWREIDDSQDREILILSNSLDETF